MYRSISNLFTENKWSLSNNENLDIKPNSKLKKKIKININKQVVCDITLGRIDLNI